MFNKEILPEIGKINLYRRFMIVFDYDESKGYQRCFSYSSPKPADNNKDLRYFRLPNKTKIKLDSSIDIPNKYLTIANFNHLIKSEINSEVKKNLMYNIINLDYVKKFVKDILEQYNVIKNNVKDNPKFNTKDVQKAHDMMIDEKKQYMFCDLELLRIECDKLIEKTKQLKKKIKEHPVDKELEKSEKYSFKNCESAKEMIVQLKNGINKRPVRKEFEKDKM
jgi:hypothetical protein